MNQAIRDVLEVARGEIGVREIGASNTGKRVQQYQASTTIGGSGWPWCAAYVSWCIQTAMPTAYRLRESYPWIPTASCDLILDWARRKNILSKTPQPGDVFLLLSSKNPNDAIHTGFVNDVSGSKFTTIEGNTNNDGSANGNGVYALSRTLSKRYVFVRWANLLSNLSESRWAVKVGPKTLEAILDDGRAWIKSETWANAMGFELGWNQDVQAVTLDGREVPVQPKLQDGKSWLPVRALADFSGLKLNVSPGVIEVTK